MEQTKEIIAGIRTLRLQKNIPLKEQLELQVLGSHSSAFNSVIVKLGNLTEIHSVSEKASGSISFLVGTTEYAVPMAALINPEEEIKKMESEIVYYEGFIVSVMKKLGNEKFVANAKPEVVHAERKKLADAESKIASLRESIAALR